MKTRMLSALCAGLLACGGEDEPKEPPPPPPPVEVDHAPSWAGLYSGTNHQKGTCSDGTTIDQTLNVSYTLAASAKDEVSIAVQPANPCVLQFDVTATVATLRPRSCPSFESGGSTFQANWTSGTLTLSPPNVAGTLRLHGLFLGETCDLDNNISVRR